MGTMVVRHTILILFYAFLCFSNLHSFAQDKGVLRLISEKQETSNLIEKFKELNKPLVFYRNNIYSPDSVCFTKRLSAERFVERTSDNHVISRTSEEHTKVRNRDGHNANRKLSIVSAQRNLGEEVGTRSNESFVARRNGVEGFVQEKKIPTIEPPKPVIIDTIPEPIRPPNKVSFSGKGCFWNSLGGLFGGCGGLGKGCFNLFAPKSAKNISTVQVISDKDFFCRKLKGYAGFEMLGIAPTEKMQVIDIMGIRTVTAGFIDYY